MLDVAVHADGAAVHDAADACRRRRFNHRADRCGIDLVIDAVAQPRLPVQSGDVVDDVDAGGRTPERRGVAEIAGRQLDACGAQPPAAGRVAHQRAHLVAARAKGVCEMAAREPAGARD